MLARYYSTYQFAYIRPLGPEALPTLLRYTCVILPRVQTLTVRCLLHMARGTYVGSEIGRIN